MGVRAMSDAVSYAGGGDVLIPTRRHVPYCRREKSGYYSLIGNNGSSSFSMINETAREIIELCDGRKTLGEIFACLRDEYPDAQAETINEIYLTRLMCSTDCGLLASRTRWMQK